MIYITRDYTMRQMKKTLILLLLLEHFSMDYFKTRITVATDKSQA